MLICDRGICGQPGYGEPFVSAYETAGNPSFRRALAAGRPPRETGASVDADIEEVRTARGADGISQTAELGDYGPRRSRSCETALEPTAGTVRCLMSHHKMVGEFAEGLECPELLSDLEALFTRMPEEDI